MFRIRVFGISITGIIIIIAYNKNNRRDNNLILFYNLLRT
jgi:hypothetical protein